ncbi:MAG: DUF1501 domain-containing protein [Thiolinea sp.]
MMNKKRGNHTKHAGAYSRRSFLQALLGAGVSGSLGVGGQLALMRQATAASPGFSDYKALVCVLLNGGNDSLNMLIPFGSEPGQSYEDYAAIRGDLAVANNDLGLASVSSVNGNINGAPLGQGSDNPYYANHSTIGAYKKGLYELTAKSIPLAVNGLMPELAQLIIDDKASILSNIGNLVRPVSRSGILNETADLPLFLFAHNHQRRALQTGRGDDLNDIGWAGRIADDWLGVNDNHPLGLNISYAGNTPMMLGKSTAPLVLTSGIPPEYKAMEFRRGAGQNDRRALFKALAGQQGQSRNVAFRADSVAQTIDPFRNFYHRSLLKSMQVFDALSEAWPDGGTRYSSKDTYGNPLFSVPSADTLGLDSPLRGAFIRELQNIATMIDLGARNAFTAGTYNRQIFMVSLNGFDTHGAQSGRHAPLLRELSLGLWSFQKAMEELGHANKVLTYTMSEFGRTVSNNGDGTDHGWGAHHLIMGGDGTNRNGQFQGGKIVGKLPDIRLGSKDDYRDKGRLIPGIAQDQLNATLCDWLGVDERLMARVFPNVQNFSADGRLRSAYLNQLFA